ncbi:MAG TPA: phosphatase PAP2 family protein [Spirillospora sp.]
MASALGSSGLYVAVLLVLFWCVAPRPAARAAVLLLFGAYLNTLLKFVFHDPRPYWTDPAVEGEQAISSFGMPSGHAQNAATGWGFAALQTRRRALWAGAAVVIVLIGLSRVYLGVHSIGQVLAGWGIGFALLGVALIAGPYIVTWWTSRRLAVQLVLALAVSLLLLGAAWAALEPLDGWRWPAAWTAEIREAGGRAEPLTPAEPARAAGGLGGVLAGLSVLKARGWFVPGDGLWRRLACLPVALGGGAVVYLPAILIGGSGSWEGFAVHAALGLWVTAGAPEAFVGLRLAARPTPDLTRPGEEAAGTRQ